MGSYPRVLIGTDGSVDSAIAVDVGSTIAARLGVPVSILTVWTGDDNVPGSRDYEWAKSVTDNAEELVTGRGVSDVTGEQLSGKPEEELLRVATEQPETLLVVGGRGLTKASSRVSGSVSNRLSHHSPADVLFAQGPLRESGARVGLTTDGSVTSRLAVRRGLELALALGATPHVVTVAKDQGEGERLMGASLGELGIDVPDVTPERDILIGVLPAKALIDAASNYDIMVIGNRSMSGPSRLLGSIANKVTHGVEGNLLLVNTSSE
ncbi:universal stress protein [Antrihabitans cavernicola]|nr:universal stress protein [Spelaeibacter cavernicola]